jgi:hypothetical protein
MAASGKPITGKNGSLTVTNVTGATPTYSVALDLKDFSHEGSADEVKGSRLGGDPHVESGDATDSGKFTAYVAKSDDGVTIPFVRGDHIAFTGTYGGNTLTGTDIIVKKVGIPTVERGSFVTFDVEWTATSGGFTSVPKVITVA